MARNEHLPIYKSAYDLCLWLEQVVRGFSRYHSEPRDVAAASAIGSDLRTMSRRILRLVVRANARSDKADALLDLREEVEAMKATMRLAFDAEAIEGIASFEHGMRLVVEIAKQNEGWLRSQPSAVQGRGRNRGSSPQETATAATGAP